MNHSQRRTFCILFIVLFLPVMAFGQTPAGLAAFPRSGTLDPQFRTALMQIEEEILTVMAERDIPGAIVALSRHGTVVMERGYGWMDEALTEPMPAQAKMRIASLSKPVVAAALHELLQEGLLSLEDYAFDLGQDEGGVLPVNPLPELGDQRLTQIRVEHLLRHAAGWDRSEAGDLTFQEVEIAAAVGVPSPPSRQVVLNYILGQPLQFDPGEDTSYSNIGFLALGLIIEHLTEQDLMTVIHERVLRPLDISPQDYIQGATFREDQSPREPFYHSSDQRRNVFDPAGPRIHRPYGAWHHEARIGSGGHVATARALVTFLNNRYISGPSIGQPIPANAGVRWRWNHLGSLPGTNALARQRGDGISYAVVFNKRHAYSGEQHFGAEVRNRVDALLDSEIRWQSGSISTDSPIITANQPITVEFSGGSDATDWIGIYPTGIRPTGNPPSAAWLYVNGTRRATTSVAEGRVTFSNHALPPGTYELWFLARDGYEVIAGPIDLEIQRR